MLKRTYIDDPLSAGSELAAASNLVGRRCHRAKVTVGARGL